MNADREVRIIAPTAAETEFLLDEIAKLFPSCFKSRIEANNVRGGYRAYLTILKNPGLIDAYGSGGK